MYQYICNTVVLSDVGKDEDEDDNYNESMQSRLKPKAVASIASYKSVSF